MTDAASELPDRVGGRLALDFLNTVDPRHATERREYLGSYEGLLAWAADTGTVDRATVGRLRAAADQEPAAAAAALRRVRDYREALYRVVAAALAERPVQDADLALVNAVLREATVHHVLLPGAAGGVRDGWLSAGGLDEMLWPVAVDAWDLLDRAGAGPGEGVPRGRGGLRLAVRRHLPQRDPTVVRHAHVRQPGEGARALRAGARLTRRLTSGRRRR